MKRFHPILLILFCLLAPCNCQQNTGQTTTATATVVTGASSHAFTVEVADSAAERQTGLMNRTSMDDDAGMLFVWDQNILTSFWMQNTYIPLDIIFIDENLEIIYIAENTTPLSTDLITPTGQFRYALEVNGGESAQRGISVGDRIELDL